MTKNTRRPFAIAARNLSGGGNQNTRSRNEETVDDRPQSEVWLNPIMPYGYDDEGNIQAASLAYGIAIDTMPDADKRRMGPNNAALADAFRDRLLAMAEDLEPGETIRFSMDVELRRKGPERQAEGIDDALAIIRGNTFDKPSFEEN